jgi:virginiamycin B lyase
VGHDNNLWFTEAAGNKIGRITPAGTITEFSIPTTGSTPEGIAPGPDANVWFVEYSGNKIAFITPAGAITEYNSYPQSPTALVTGSDNNLWLTEGTHNKIARQSGLLSAAPVIAGTPTQGAAVSFGPVNIAPLNGNVNLAIPLDFRLSMPDGSANRLPRFRHRLINGRQAHSERGPPSRATFFGIL